MKINCKQMSPAIMILVFFLLLQNAWSQDVMITGWVGLVFGAQTPMETHITSLGYTVTSSNIFPASLDGYEILIIMGRGVTNEDIPESVMDNFVNNGGGLLILEGSIAGDNFDETANSSPVHTHTGWNLSFYE